LILQEVRLEYAKCGDDDPRMLLKERGLLVSCRGRTLRLGPFVVLQVEQDWLGLFGRLTLLAAQFEKCFQIPAREIAGDPDSPSGTSGERAEVFWTEKLQALVEPTLVGER
jgi:hypothetical protein